MMVSLLVLSVVVGLAGADYAVLHAESEDGAKQTDACAKYNSLFSTPPAQYDRQVPHRLLDLTNVTECEDVRKLPFSFRSRVVAIAPNTCIYTTNTLERLQELESYAVLVVNFPNASQQLMPSVQNFQVYSQINLTIGSIFYQDFTKIKGLGENATVWLFVPKVPRFDPSMVLIILLAVACVVAGGLWGMDFLAEETKSDYWWNLCCGCYFYIVSCGRRCDEIGGFIILLTYFACLSGLLVLLYFFYDYMVYIIIALFCVYGSLALCACLLPLWEKIFPCDRKLPLVKWTPEIRAVVLFLLCAGLAIFWAVQRKASYAWILQDAFGVAMCTYCVRVVRVPNLKVCSIILAIVFVYDVFFVFITPFFTKDHRSIMESVALGGEETTTPPVQASSREQLPILFRLPSLMASTMQLCMEFSMLALGFGDVVFPGILIAHNIRFDRKVKTPGHLYFVLSTLGYAVSLGLAYVAVIFMKRGQPALLYIVPITLLVTVIIACVRGELRLIFTGEERQSLLGNPEQTEEEMEMNKTEKQ